MYAPPMPLEQPPMVDRPGVRALRGARPQMTPEMQRMRDWANSQRTATAANARNGDFILSQGPDGPPAGVSLPTQLSTGDYTPGGPSGLFGDWRSAAPSRPGPNGPGGPSGLFGDWRSAAPSRPGPNGPGGPSGLFGDWRSAAPSRPGPNGPGGPSGLFGDWRSAAPSRPGPNGPGGPNDVERLPPPPEVGKPMPPVKPGMLPVKPGMEPPPPDKGRRLTGRRG